LSAPAAVDHSAALDEAYDLLISIGRRALTNGHEQREAATAVDTAAPSRPLVGAMPTQHEAGVSRRKDAAGFEEDDRRGLTSTDA
jgi:hypothetical protein